MRTSLTVLMPVKQYHPVFLHTAVASIVRQSSPRWHLLVLIEPEDAGRFEEILCSEIEDPRIDRSDGTTYLLFEPVEFLEKLTSRPDIDPVLSHGVLAPHARWRAEVVA